jgi:hypothetical protein
MPSIEIARIERYRIDILFFTCGLKSPEKSHSLLLLEEVCDKTLKVYYSEVHNSATPDSLAAIIKLLARRASVSMMLGSPWLAYYYFRKAVGLEDDRLKLTSRNGMKTWPPLALGGQGARFFIHLLLDLCNALLYRSRSNRGDRIAPGTLSCCNMLVAQARGLQISNIRRLTRHTEEGPIAVLAEARLLLQQAILGSYNRGSGFEADVEALFQRAEELLLRLRQLNTETDVGLPGRLHLDVMGARVALELIEHAPQEALSAPHEVDALARAAIERLLQATDHEPSYLPLHGIDARLLACRYALLHWMDGTSIEVAWLRHSPKELLTQAEDAIERTGYQWAKGELVFLRDQIFTETKKYSG